MNNIGFHVSISGGIINAPQRARDFNCDVFQCFTRSPQGGPAPLLDTHTIETFQKNIQTNKIKAFYIHAPYYINFASQEPRIAHSSSKIIREELERGSLLGARYIMAHVGSHADQTVEEGMEKVVNGIKKSLSSYTGSTEFLIEISAGAGSVIGDTFDEMGYMVSKLKDEPGFAGVCFDTCHAFGAGYDFRTPEKAGAMLGEFDQKIGLEYLKLSHVQDSKVDLGGKRDRHEHIGEGFIGKEGLASLLKTKTFQSIDWLLETEPSRIQEDIKKLQTIKSS